MYKYKIRIIDSHQYRAESIFEALKPYNSWTQDQTVIPQYFSWSDNDQPYLEPRDQQAELVFCHISDLVDAQLDPMPQYLNDCIDKNIPVVLYSAGGVEWFAQEQDLIYLRQTEYIWPVKKSDLLCIVSDAIHSHNDLNLEKAMPLFAGSRGKFMRQIKIKNLLFEDLGILFSILMNPECWSNAEKKIQLRELCFELWRETQHDTPEAFWRTLEKLRIAGDYQAEVRRFFDELYEKLSHIL